ncbi:type III chaperone protein ShcF, partial [Pseudomonas syringae pv. actinidiae ICMP 19102]
MFLLLRDRKNGRFAAAGCPVRFDRLIDGLAKDYGMPSFPEKKHEHEIYCFEFETGVSIKIYQDKFRWVYFVAEIGQLHETNADAMM